MKRAERNLAGAASDRRRRRGGGSWTAAVTLTELVVAMGVLVLIVGVFNSLMVTCQRVVKGSQATIKTNAEARAIIAQIRADLHGLTKEGFLAITYRDEDGPPHLIFTSVSGFRSMVDTNAANNAANAARVGFGLTGDPAEVLYRRAMLQGTADSADDHERLSLAFYRANTQTPRTDIADLLFSNNQIGGIDYLGVVTNPPAITLPALNLTHIAGLWPYMTGEVSDLRIQWTRPDPDSGQLVWYDKDAPLTGAWKSRNAAHQDSNPTEDWPEFQSSTGAYCALWTFKKKDNWPTALRLQMELGDPTRRYELIVDLTR